MITSRTSHSRYQADRGSRFARPAERPGAEPVTGPSLVLGEAGGERTLLEIPYGWSRIGSSPVAELRIADPSVSRRHALIVRSSDDRLQIIDDRSLTGVFLNGEKISWSELGDGDELMIGRVRVIVASGP